MLNRKVTYIWICNLCHKEERKDFDVMAYEDFPILHDPPNRWVKYIGPKGEEHWCPKCVEKMIKLDKVSVDWDAIADKGGSGKGDIIRIERINK